MGPVVSARRLRALAVTFDHFIINPPSIPLPGSSRAGAAVLLQEGAEKGKNHMYI